MQDDPTNGGTTLDRLGDLLDGARIHERMLAVDLAETRETIEQLLEERWIALGDLADRKATAPVWSGAPPTAERAAERALLDALMEVMRSHLPRLPEGSLLRGPLLRLNRRLTHLAGQAPLSLHREPPHDEEGQS